MRRPKMGAPAHGSKTGISLFKTKHVPVRVHMEANGPKKSKHNSRHHIGTRGRAPGPKSIGAALSH